MSEVIDPKLAAALAHFFVAMAFDDFGFLLVKSSKLLWSCGSNRFMLPLTSTA